MTTHRPLAVLVAGLLLGAVAVVSPPALASDNRNETIRTGPCTGTSDWKFKAKADDGGLEVEAEVDSSRSGQVWRWVIRHNGTVSARGASVTAGRSGSFDIERRMTDLSGTDRFVIRATNPSSGEMCRGALDW